MPLRVYKRGRHYWVRGTVPGRPAVRQSLQTRNAEVAHRRAAEMELGLSSGQSPLTWADLERRFLARYSGNTQRRYRLVLTKLRAFMTARRKELVHETTSLDLEDFEAARNLSANSRRREVAHLRTIFRWAVRHRVIGKNIAKRVSMPAGQLAETQPLEQSQLLALDGAIDELVTVRPAGPALSLRTRAMFEIMRTAGLRVSDVVRLRPEHLVGGYIVLPQTKTQRQVRISLVETARAALAEVKPNNAGYFFWTGESFKAACDSVWRTFQRLGKRAGVANCHPHRLRDTFAVNLLLDGADIRLVSRLLGHTSIKTTEKHYAPWVRAFQEQADEAMRRAELRYKNGTAANQPV